MAAPTEHGNDDEKAARTTDPVCLADCDCISMPKAFTENILLTLTQIKGEVNWKDEVEGFNQQEYFDKLDNLLSLLHREVTVLSVAYTNPPLPKCAEAEKLFERLTRCVLAIISNLYHLPLRQGQALFRQWHTFHISLFTALYEYSKSLWSENQQNVPQNTGVIWGLCNSAGTLAKTNKDCLGLKQKQVLNLVIDALTELEEAKSVYSNDGLTPDDEPVSEYDFSVLIAGIGLVKTAKILLQKATKSVQTSCHPETETLVVDCDMLSKLLDVTSERVDDFSASLYPPSNKQEVKENLTPLTDHLNCVLDTFRQSHFCSEIEMQWTVVIENAISHNHAKVSSLVS